MTSGYVILPAGRPGVGAANREPAGPSRHGGGARRRPGVDYVRVHLGQDGHLPLCGAEAEVESGMQEYARIVASEIELQ